MSDSKTTNEPSIEDILGSIRRIIADDEPVETTASAASASPTSRQMAPAAPSSRYDEDEDFDDDMPLELTQKIDEDGTVIDLQKADAPATNREYAGTGHTAPVAKTDALPRSPAPSRSTVTSESDMIDFQDTSTDSTNDPLVSSIAANATAAVMAKLARNTAINRPGQEGLTIEDMVKDMLRPMLRDWLDKNLPEMVQNMVERELDKISRRVG